MKSESKESFQFSSCAATPTQLDVDGIKLKACSGTGSSARLFQLVFDVTVNVLQNHLPATSTYCRFRSLPILVRSRAKKQARSGPLGTAPPAPVTSPFLPPPVPHRELPVARPSLLPPPPPPPSLPQLRSPLSPAAVTTATPQTVTATATAAPPLSSPLPVSVVGTKRRWQELSSSPTHIAISELMEANERLRLENQQLRKLLEEVAKVAGSFWQPPAPLIDDPSASHPLTPVPDAGHSPAQFLSESTPHETETPAFHVDNFFSEEAEQETPSLHLGFPDNPFAEEDTPWLHFGFPENLHEF